jgi:uracil-DNA glycosylase
MVDQEFAALGGSATSALTATEKREIRLESSWKRHLLSEFHKDYMRDLRQFIKAEMNAKKRIFPRPSEYFAALDATPFDAVKVVILGQDPYHGPGQAHGLCFSVREGIAVPPSLQNIFKELQKDVGFQIPAHGCLTKWAQQGVLLLNATLSVEAGLAGSHQGRGWELFTDRIIAVLNAERKHLVFLLWGSFAQKKGAQIDETRHLVLRAPHPSPLSAHRGFFGSRPFSQANTYLVRHGEKPIDWQI